MGSAWLSPDDEQLILVFVNVADTPAIVDLTVHGKGRAPKSYVPHLTTGATADDLRPLPPVSKKDGLIVPARSIVTFVATDTP
jgi:hypothetical protein